MDPNLRITLKDIVKKPLYKDLNWEAIRKRDIYAFDKIPYTPNANKFRYLLEDDYPDVSNLVSCPPSACNKDDPGSASSPTKRLLGDFTVYKVN